MQSLRIANATRVLAESQDEYHALAILDENIEGHNMMSSLWEPTPAEIEIIKNGGSVKLSIMGISHPPVMLTVQPAPEI